MAGVAGADHADHAFALDDLAIFTSALDGRSDFHFLTPIVCIAFDSMTERPGVHAPVPFVIRAVCALECETITTICPETHKS